MNLSPLRMIENNAFFYIIILLYKLVLDFSYVNFVSPYFSYAGFNLNFNVKNYIFSFCVFLIFIIIIPKILNKISDYFLAIWSFNIIIPMICLYGLNYEFSFFAILVNILAYIVVFFSLKLRFFNKRVLYPYILNGEFIFRSICLFMIFYLVGWYFLSGAVSNFNLDLTKVYDFRDENAELTNVGVLAYFNSWVLKVFSLSLMAYFLLKKEYKFFLLILIIQIFFFGVSAHKSVLFAPFLIFGIYYYLSKTKTLSTIPLLFTLMIIFCLILYYLNDNVLVGSMLIRRLFFVPNYLNFIYFDFFKTNGFAYWTNTFSFLGTPIYPNGIPTTIGSYLGSDELRANTGFISSGYAQAGLYGVSLYIILLILILKFIDQISQEIGCLWFALCIVITPLRSILISSDIFTVMLTHGLLIAIFLLFILRNLRSKNEY